MVGVIIGIKYFNLALKKIDLLKLDLEKSAFSKIELEKFTLRALALLKIAPCKLQFSIRESDNFDSLKSAFFIETLNKVTICILVFARLALSNIENSIFAPCKCASDKFVLIKLVLRITEEVKLAFIRTALSI